MALNLNDNIVLPYEEFYGANVKQMPKLIAAGRVPLSVAGLMDRRLRAGESASTWRDNYFDTGDAFVYDSSGKFKIVLDAQPLREITPSSKLRNGALILPDGMYQTLQGTEFSRKDMKDIVDGDLKASDVKKHPVWQALARGDQGLLDEYVGTMFADMKKRWNYDTAMGVYLASEQDVPTLRAACVVGLGGGSRLGGGSLDLDFGRFAGVAPEALGAPGKVIQTPSLETALAVVNEKLLESGMKLNKQ